MSDEKNGKGLQVREASSAKPEQKQFQRSVLAKESESHSWLKSALSSRNPEMEISQRELPNATLITAEAALLEKKMAMAVAATCL